MRKQVSKINDRTRIRYGNKQRLIKGTDPSKGLTNNDELSLDSRSHCTLTPVFFQRDTAHDVFNRIAGFKDILKIGR